MLAFTVALALVAYANGFGIAKDAEKASELLGENVG
jgi:hypothetical protein